MSTPNQQHNPYLSSTEQRIQTPRREGGSARSVHSQQQPPARQQQQQNTAASTRSLKETHKFADHEDDDDEEEDDGEQSGSDAEQYDLPADHSYTLELNKQVAPALPGLDAGVHHQPPVNNYYNNAYYNGNNTGRSNPVFTLPPGGVNKPRGALNSASQVYVDSDAESNGNNTGHPSVRISPQAHSQQQYPPQQYHPQHQYHHHQQQQPYLRTGLSLAPADGHSGSSYSAQQRKLAAAGGSGGTGGVGLGGSGTGGTGRAGTGGTGRAGAGGGGTATRSKQPRGNNGSSNNGGGTARGGGGGAGRRAPLTDTYNVGPTAETDMQERVRVIPNQRKSKLRNPNDPPPVVPEVKAIIAAAYIQEKPDFTKILCIDEENPDLRGPERVTTLTSEQQSAVDTFETMYNYWCARSNLRYVNERAETDRNDVRRHLESLFGMENADYNLANVQMAYDVCKMNFVQVREAMLEHNLEKLGTARGNTNTYGSELNQIQEVMYYGFYSLVFMLQFEQIRDGKSSGFESPDVNVFRFKAPHATKVNDDIHLVLHVIRECRIRNLRIDADQLYIERKTRVGGWGTSSWKKYKKLNEFLSMVCPKETAYDQWMRAVGHSRTLYNYLKDFNDIDLPHYKPDWGTISYEDCLYYSETDTFWEHSDPKKPKHLVAQWYIPQKADRTEVKDDPFVIYTPIRKILEDQKYTKEEQFIFCALIGRLFFPLRKLDQNEIVLFLWGLGGTGKSTFINCVRAFFNPDDVGKISNRPEEIFGLESIYNKMFAECSDVTRTFRMDTGDLLCICSGEYTAVKRKNKEQLSAKWLTPVMFAGNEFPASWVDRKKNLLRRIFIADFRTVITADLNLQEEIGETLASSHRFFIVCYLKLVRSMKLLGLDLWSIVEKSTPRFINNRIDMLQANSELLAFLYSSPDCVFDPQAYTTETELLTRFTSWCQLRNIKPKGEARPQEMNDTLQSQGCKIIHDSRVWPNDGINTKMITEKFVVGLTFKMTDLDAKMPVSDEANQANHNNNQNGDNNNNNNNGMMMVDDYGHQQNNGMNDGYGSAIPEMGSVGA